MLLLGRHTRARVCCTAAGTCISCGHGLLHGGCQRGKHGTAPQLRRDAPDLLRQRDCLLWAARGKTDWEISRILDISEETVARHIRLACDRYGVTKRVALAFCAVSERIITVHDVGPWVYNPFPA